MGNRKRSWSLSNQILLGIGLGVASGVFFGELMGVLGVIGDVFIGLLQMTVLPFIIVTLIANIGRLDPSEAKRFGLSTGFSIVLSLFLTLGVIAVLPLALPSREFAWFFSEVSLKERAPFDFLNLFVPSNPFSSLANNVVPAVAVFSIAVGLALMTLPNKKVLLDQLDILSAALSRVNGTIVRLMPLGLFAITANYAGTIESDEIPRLQAYLSLNVVSAVLVGFGILIPLLAALTSYTYGELFRAIRVPILTAFVTGKVLVVLPLIAANAEKLLDRGDGRSSRANAIAPLTYAFPHAGKLLALIFLPFAAWFVDEPLGIVGQFTYLGAGLLTMFGSPISAIPFLLDTLRLPADMFEYFLVTGILTSRLGDALGAIHIFFVVVLTGSQLEGRLRFDLSKFARSGAMLCAQCAVVFFLLRGFLSQTVEVTNGSQTLIENMRSAVGDTPVTRLEGRSDSKIEDAETTALERILSSKVLRVGYQNDVLPYSFVNGKGELVGYDIDMAQILAGQLGVEVLFVPIEKDRIEEQLEQGEFDVGMAGLTMTPGNLTDLRYCGPYGYATVAVIVPDHRRKEFRRRAERQDYRGLRLASLPSDERGDFGESIFPGASIVTVESVESFLVADGAEGDALIWSAESGAAWTLRYPSFSVVPVNPLFRVPLGYAVASQNEALAEFLDDWIEVTSASSVDEMLFDYWVQGKQVETSQPRWSVVRNVLHWIE